MAESVGGPAATRVAIRGIGIPILVFICPNCEKPASSYTLDGNLEIDRHGQVTATRGCARCDAAFSVLLGIIQARDPES